jgi:hypothetical protein
VQKKYSSILHCSSSMAPRRWQARPFRLVRASENRKHRMPASKRKRATSLSSPLSSSPPRFCFPAPCCCRPPFQNAKWKETNLLLPVPESQVAANPEQKKRRFSSLSSPLSSSPSLLYSGSSSEAPPASSSLSPPRRFLLFFCSFFSRFRFSFLDSRGSPSAPSGRSSSSMSTGVRPRRKFSYKEKRRFG